MLVITKCLLPGRKPSSSRTFGATIPGVSFVHVDLSLWGLTGRVRTVSPERRFLSEMRVIEDNNYLESSTFPVRELADEPVAVATELLDRLLTSFDAADVLTDILGS